MKKIISLVLITTLLLISCTGCFFKENQTVFEEELTIDLNNLYEDLVEKLPLTTDIKAQKEYLIKWANIHNIPVSYDNNNNIIMSKKATEGYEDAKNTIIQCNIGSEDSIKQYQALATSLYLINNVEKHGFIRVIFTSIIDNKFTGAQTISTNYLRADNLINLTWAKKTSFTIGSAGTSEYDFSKELEWIKPTYPNAYEISIKGLNGGSSGITSGRHPNPIKIIGDFLASAKSKGVLIELASFNGGETAGNYPSNATAVLLINDNDKHKFEKWFNSYASKFDNKYNDIEKNYSYTMTPVECPQFVISKEDSTNILSLLYTMINGIYLKSDEGKIIATSNIGTIGTTSGNLDLTICARSLNEDTLKEMSSTFEIICGLNNVSYNVTNQTPIWNENTESPLLIRLTDLFLNDFDKKISNKTITENTECALFKTRNENLDIISVSVNFDNGVTEIEALQSFLESLNEPMEPTPTDPQE